ncbi:MAG: response regulator transcription factor [Phycisphaerales bacterium]|nr:response regulator transcription factor [Phycisphaerales bacterium]
MTNSNKYKVFLCEDDTNLGNLLKKHLELNDFEVILERDGRAALSGFHKHTYDICLLDVMMPHVDGFTLAEEIRKDNPEVPLFFISAKNLKEDIIKGYKLGADDYISKPFDVDVLLHKIRAIIKRHEDDNNKLSNSSTVYNIGQYAFNTNTRELTSNDKTIVLSPKESRLMELLIEAQGNLVSREFALRKIWGSDTYFNGRSMDVYIVKLRKYLKDDSKLEIVNVHGSGFRLITNAQN